MSNRHLPVTAIGLIAVTFLVAGCENPPQGLAFLQPKAGTETEGSTPAATRIVERDVEAPEVFHVTDAGLWDGRPSLGGVWVAHPDVGDPERVLIRNTANDKFVIGALFRRERDLPGPRLQTSSDAAAALGMLAGAPVQLSVTALRREEAPEPAAVPETAPEEADAIETAAAITQQPLDPIAAAGAALDAPATDADVIQTAAAAASTGTAPATAASTAAAPAAAAPRAVSSLNKSFIQIGIFSVERNAESTAGMMRNAGLQPSIRAQSANGKSYWRVLVGPAQSSSERNALLKRVKEMGFTDAYAVSN